MRFVLPSLSLLFSILYSLFPLPSLFLQQVLADRAMKWRRTGPPYHVAREGQGKAETRAFPTMLSLKLDDIPTQPTVTTASTALTHVTGRVAVYVPVLSHSTVQECVCFNR